MKLEIEIVGRRREVEIDESGGRFRLTVDGRVHEGTVLRPEPGVYTFQVGSRIVEARVSSLVGTPAYRVETARAGIDVRVIDRKHRIVGGDSGAEGRQTLSAPMPGKIVAVLVEVGTEVERGQGVLVVEAMKMQNEIKSPKAGTVSEVRVSVGDTVNAGQILALID